jgi:hypothetical protein
MISNILPVKGVTLQEGDTNRPCTPYKKYFGVSPRIHKFRVFGLPALVKVYRRFSPDGNVLQLSNIIQRGVRGIFVGFPINQAGWQVFIPSSGHLLTSCDVQFDEEFQSVLQYNFKLFHDAMPTRANPPELPLDNTIRISHTGPPFLSSTVEDIDDDWATYSAIPPTMKQDDYYYKY